MVISFFDMKWVTVLIEKEVSLLQIPYQKHSLQLIFADYIYHKYEKSKIPENGFVPIERTILQLVRC
jgi:hypothetical protein